MKKRAPGFGLIIIGSEVLSGRKEEAHFKNALRLLSAQGYEIKYSVVIPDDAELILSKLRWAMARPEALFCFGGIGATPDDLTRQCAAQAAGLPLKKHPEAVRVIEKMYGKRAYPIRIRMAELPKGSELIPNPLTKVAGFSVGKHHFFPGFPEMALPMMEWVLKKRYKKGEGRITQALVAEASEGEMVPMMEQFVAAHPEVSFFSLPMMKQNQESHVRLGVVGLPKEAAAAFQHLTALLDQNKFPWKKE